jgi:hypothetical protein
VAQASEDIKARQKISEKLLADLAEVWEEHGKDVLTKLAVADSGTIRIWIAA